MPSLRGQETGLKVLRPMLEQATATWQWLVRKRTAQLAGRRMKLAETVSLGEKRFVSILQVDGAQYLIGNSAAGVQLLARLDEQAGKPLSGVLS